MFVVKEVEFYYQKIKPSLVRSILLLNNMAFQEFQIQLNTLKEDLVCFKKAQSEETILNETYMLGVYLKLLSCYAELWSKIVIGKYASSWVSLQDSLDCLRLTKKFAKNIFAPEILYFEKQLTELEKLYPYNVFFSIGATVEWFECSICKKDIDSQECPHFRGELYQGEMAHAVAHGLANVDHVAMVKYPVDKRCVVTYEDNAEQFKLVRYLSELLSTKKLGPLDFGELVFQKRIIKNPDYQHRERNELCYCGSGKKHKNCCIGKELIEGKHVNIVSAPRKYENVFK